MGDGSSSPATVLTENPSFLMLVSLHTEPSLTDNRRQTSSSRNLNLYDSFPLMVAPDHVAVNSRGSLELCKERLPSISPNITVHIDPSMLERPEFYVQTPRGERVSGAFMLQG